MGFGFWVLGLRARVSVGLFGQHETGASLSPKHVGILGGGGLGFRV